MSLSFFFCLSTWLGQLSRYFRWFSDKPSNHGGKNHIRMGASISLHISLSFSVFISLPFCLSLSFLVSLPDWDNWEDICAGFPTNHPTTGAGTTEAKSEAWSPTQPFSFPEFHLKTIYRVSGGWEKCYWDICEYTMQTSFFTCLFFQMQML